MNNEKETLLEKLYSLTKEKPYTIVGKPEEYKLLQLAQELRAFFIVKKDIIYSWNMLKSFFELELDKFFENRQDASNVDIFTLFYAVMKYNFFNRFRVEFPLLIASDFNINQAEYEHVKREFEMQYEELSPFNNISDAIFWTPYEKDYPEYSISYEHDYPFLPPQMIVYYLLMKFNITKYNYYFDGTLGDFVFEDNKKDLKKFPLYVGIIKGIINSSNKRLSINKLIDSINFDTDAAYEFNFPLTSEQLKPVIEWDYNEYFEKSFYSWEELNLQEDYIALNEEKVEEIQKYLNEHLQDYNKIKSNEVTTQQGLMAVYYNGEQFPLKDSKEFIKLKRFIDFIAVENFEEDVKKYFASNSIEINNLNAILFASMELENNNDSLTQINKWKQKNLKIAFYPTEYENAEFLEFLLSFTNSPILKTDPIYNNFFADVINNLKVKMAGNFENKKNKSDERK